MFSKTMMPYVAAVNSIELGSETKHSLVAIAVANCVAYFVAIPSAPVEAPEMHYNVTAAQQVNSILSQFNEAAVMNVRYAQDLARKFWLYRYYSVYAPIKSMPPVEGDCFFYAVTQVNRFFSPHEIEQMEKYTKELWNLRTAILPVMVEKQQEEIKRNTPPLSTTAPVV